MMHLHNFGSTLRIFVKFYTERGQQVDENDFIKFLQKKKKKKGVHLFGTNGPFLTHKMDLL